VLCDVYLSTVGGGERYCLTDTDSLPPGYLREAGKYEILVSSPGQLEDIEVVLSDGSLVPTELRITADKTFGRWTWEIFHYAGEVELRVRAGGEVLHSTILDVAPHPNKLGREHHAELLEDLQKEAEGLIFGLTAAGLPLCISEAASPPISQFCLYRALLPVIMKTFSAIQDRPHRRLHALREDVALRKVRRCDSQTVVRAARNVFASAVLGGRTLDVTDQATLNVQRLEHTYDTAPNGYVKLLLCSLATKASLLAEKLYAYRHDDPEIRQRAIAWAAQLREYRSRIHTLARAGFLAGVQPAPPDPSAMITIARHPEYARLSKLATLILRPGICLGQSNDTRLTLRATYELYEYWCFFKLASLLQSLLPDLNWCSSVNVHNADLLTELPNRSYVRGQGDGLYVTLTFQRSYGHAPDKAPTPHSISTECRPDFVLSIQNGPARSLVIFDAKYRSSYNSIREALRDMHVYRDAIRCTPDKPAVRAAYILVPSFQRNSGISRFFGREYRERYRFGGFVFTPAGGQDAEIAAAIKKELGSLQPGRSGTR